MSDWYYQGQYGQVGPITTDQVKELADLGGITGTTYMWRDGLADWIRAVQIPEVKSMLPVLPPAPPSFDPAPPPSFSAFSSPQPHFPQDQLASPFRSRKSRFLAAILNLMIPGVGRLYLGYLEVGLLQFCLAFVGVGIFWSWFDGITMLFGAVKFDGEGKVLY